MKHTRIHSWLLIAGICAAFPSVVQAKSWAPAEWPVLRHYDAQHLKEISLPLGGIGTGTVGLGGRGELRDWEIMNVPARKFSTVQDGSNDAPFFAIYVKPEGGEAKTKMLAGPLYDDEYLHGEGRPAYNHGMPRFANASFDAAYPLGQVNLSDNDMPVKVRIKGFNPLVPGDEEMSGLPLAVLSYEVTNTSSQPIEAAVCGSIRNYIGKDGVSGGIDWKGDFVPSSIGRNKNTYQEDAATGLKGILFTSESQDTTHVAWGSFCLSTDAGDGVSYRLMSADNFWSLSTLDFWDDFSADGVIQTPVANARKSVGNDEDPLASLCVKQTLKPGETRAYNFYLTWNFPNRKAWSQEVVGNWYSVHHPDPWKTAIESSQNVGDYEAQTLQFVKALLGSSYPDAVKEAALFNLSVLRSQTVFRLPSGHMMGWEGVFDRAGSCMGSCTHVWNYEVASPFLFGNLARTMREVETEYATNEDGAMAFRVNLPLDKQTPNPAVAADGQMGCIMKFYRDWQLSGDMKFLSDHWDKVKSDLSFAWREKSWDGNCDGVMEGAQHNTMDVSYYGPNPQMGFWYMGALRAAEEMAKAMKDKEFAQKCHDLFVKGSAWMDANLFNGEYYEHKITNPNNFEEFMDPASPDIPPFQLGNGCLVDQLVGQYMAHICGLGYLGDKDHIHTTLQSIMKYNYQADYSNHFNNMRSYVLGHESGLLMAAYPKGRLEVPFPYFRETMTGFEYAAAIGMIQEGDEADGLKCIQAIRNRFDGAKRNPFSEPECGHHYARSMASWGAILAYTDFHYSGIDHSMSFANRPGTWFWSNGYSWGTVQIGADSVALTVLKGSLSLKKLTIGTKTTKKSVNLAAGETFNQKL